MAGSDRLILVGAGGFGREIICWAEDCAAAGTLPKLGGYLDDEVAALPGYDVSRLGGIKDFSPGPKDLFVVALGQPGAKREVVERLLTAGGRFATLRHPTAIVVRTAFIGDGVIMCPFAGAMPDTRIERFATLLNYSAVGHDSVLGEFSTLSAFVDVTGKVRVGRDVMVGSGARILPGLKVGDGATVGAGAVVMRSVKPGTTVYAAPAKTLDMHRKPAA